MMDASRQAPTRQGVRTSPADERDGVCENIDEPYQVETVMLTQDQFDKLPEWEG